MAAIVPNQNSGEVVKSTPTLNSGNRTELKPNEYGGRLRTMRFSFFPAVAVAAGQIINLGTLPPGARVLAIDVFSNATVATSTLSVGLAAADGGGTIDGLGGTGVVADSGTFFGSGFAINAAGKYTPGATIANNNGYELLIPCFLIGTLVTAGIAGTGDGIQGQVVYVKD